MPFLRRRGKAVAGEESNADGVTPTEKDDGQIESPRAKRGRRCSNRKDESLEPKLTSKATADKASRQKSGIGVKTQVMKGTLSRPKAAEVSEGGGRKKAHPGLCLAGRGEEKEEEEEEEEEEVDQEEAADVTLSSPDVNRGDNVSPPPSLTDETEVKEVTERWNVTENEMNVVDDQMVEQEPTIEWHGPVEDSGSSWPLYMPYAIDFNTACSIILEAVQVPAGQICLSTPQRRVNEGTFVIDLSDFSNRHEVAIDGLGYWGKAQGSARFYQETASILRRVQVNSPYNIKVLCNRYQHPGTQGPEGRFFRKIYTATSDTDGPCRLAVVTYDWIGQPQDIHVTNADIGPAKRPYGGRSWELKDSSIRNISGGEWKGVPVYARAAVDFDTAVKIILGQIEVFHHGVCTRVPQGYRENGTFVVDVRAFVNENELRKDANGAWSKPSGSSRYYRIDPVSGTATRLDRTDHFPHDTDYDIQILSKRYENESPETGGRFVRKIYMGKSRNAPNMQSCCNLAVITYFWKGNPAIPFSPTKTMYSAQSERIEKGQRIEKGGDEWIDDWPILEEDLGIPAANVTLDCADTGRSQQMHQQNAANPSRLPKHVRLHGEQQQPESLVDERKVGMEEGEEEELKRLTTAKQLENQNRLGRILDRAEAFLERFEQAGAALGIDVGVNEFVANDDGSTWETRGQDSEQIEGEQDLF